MRKTLSFLMNSHCLLDPAKNAFLFEAVYGARNGGVSEILAPPRENPEWDGLAFLNADEMPLADFCEEDRKPLADSPYLGKANSLDRKRLRETLEGQLGEKIPQKSGLGDQFFGFYAQWRELPFRDGLWKAGLFGALFLCGRSRGSRGLGLEILENLNRTWRPEAGVAAKAKMDMGLSERGEDELRSCLITAHRAEDSEKLRSGFMNTLFMRLLEWAERTGPVPRGFLGWTECFDRRLSRALSQVGETEPDAEGAGPWAHLMVEKIAGRPLETAVVDPAMTAIEREMARDGWLPAEMPEAEIRENINSWLKRTD